MPITNLSSVTFTDAETTNMNSAIAAQNAVIDPKTTNLPAIEKQLYGSIAEQNKLLVQKVMEFAESNPAIVPVHADIAELKRDNAARLLLDKWEISLSFLLSNIQNTKILLDYDVYQTVLTVYRNVRYMAGEDIAGMNAIYNEMKQFFPGGRPVTDAGTEPLTAKPA